jgi:hypothetical protein
MKIAVIQKTGTQTGLMEKARLPTVSPVVLVKAVARRK